ncbi:IS1595 family transposase [Candidatus Wolfebacteria bacterium]|nr:IS1595 family transposase [Candidatus Wolfebacteria bacterium]
MYYLRQIPSETQIKRYLRRILFGKNMFCPECRSRKVVRYETRYRCKECRAKFSLLSHTWLAHRKLSYEKFWLILWCWTIREPIEQAAAITGLSDDAIRRWYGRFRARLPQETHILERIVQLDESFFKNMTLMMGKQKGTRKLAYDVIPGVHSQRHHATRFLFRKVKPRSKPWTDGAAIYQGIGAWWPIRHSRDIHRKFEFAHISEIEGIFGNYRTFVRRMYHHHWS